MAYVLGGIRNVGMREKERETRSSGRKPLKLS